MQGEPEGEPDLVEEVTTLVRTLRLAGGFLRRVTSTTTTTAPSSTPGAHATRAESVTVSRATSSSTSPTGGLVPLVVRPEASELGGSFRYYSVWKLLGSNEFAGIHLGRHPAAWSWILTQLPEGYTPGTASLRRASSLEEAERIYRTEQARHNSPAEIRYFVHQAGGPQA